MIDLGNVESAAVFGGSAGISLAIALQFFKWLLTFATSRMDAREARIDGATQKLIEQLQGQVDGLLEREVASAERYSALEHRLDDCQKKHAESEARYKKLEATMQGLGDARQHAQLIVSAEKTAGKGNGG